MLMLLLVVVVVMGVHPKGDVHLLMLMLLLPDDLLLLMMLSLAACAHHFKGDTQTPTDDTHTHSTQGLYPPDLSHSLSPTTYVYLGRPKYGLTVGGPG